VVVWVGRIKMRVRKRRKRRRRRGGVAGGTRLGRMFSFFFLPSAFPAQGVTSQYREVNRVASEGGGDPLGRFRDRRQVYARKVKVEAW
jgi:hypothetical protein